MKARRETIRRVLPEMGRVLVEKDQPVFPDTIIAETKLQPIEPVVIPVTEQLGLAPDTMGKMALVQVGDLVKAGQVIAGVNIGGVNYEVHAPADGKIEDISSLIGTIALRLEGDPNEPEKQVNVGKELELPDIMARRFLQVREGMQVKMGEVLAMDDEEVRIYAPITGEITKIEGSTVYIKRPFVLRQISAYVPGFVVEIVEDRGAIIETEVCRINGIFGMGGETWGDLRVAVTDCQGVVNAQDIRKDDQGKILLAGSFVSLEALQKAKEVGVKGIISGGINNKDLVHLAKEEIKPGVIAEDIGLTVIITEGMGPIAMNPDVFNLIAKKEGQVISINGLTQIRAGVIRPEILLPAGELEAVSHQEESPGTLRRRLSLGDSVRIVREPWFGLLGQISEIPKDEQILPSGVRTLVYKIKTEDGELIVPRANVELYERERTGSLSDDSAQS